MDTKTRTEQTLAYYDGNAEAYVQQTLAIDMAPTRQRLTSQLPANAHILDAGCGSGRDSKAFLEAGYRVTAIDGSPALAALASRYLGQPVFVRRFQELSFAPQFDGVYASGSLLHLDDAELEDALRRLFGSLRPNGQLLALFKAGDGMREEASTGRLFNDMNPQRIVPFIERAGGKVRQTWVDADTRGRGNDWLCVLATHA
jgi:SAM-dependent methyltransferase